MKSLFKKQIVDERMELQSLRNAKKSWNFLLLASALGLLVEMYLFHWEFKYMALQWAAILMAIIYNLFLDIRDGNLYTSENSSRKKVFGLYAVSSLVAALIMGFGLGSNSGALRIFLITLVSFLLVLGCMVLFDLFIAHMMRKKTQKKTTEEEE